MKLRPLHDWVVIERDPVQTEEKGIFHSSSPSNQGKVLAVGPLVKEIELDDRVWFNAYAGFFIQAVETKLTMVRSVDIVGIVV
ncbi:co-chaperone GroES [Photobacterium salinisoli]|uniref:co-chaperone GroES n=1 Tax=Photobacterium salinisoli TaxID=1616783 RepID=UPI000EA40BA9|nr:co-chaperone GroES [Photobacterium salinisoli]